MSADDAIFVQQREDGKWAGQWGSMSADEPPAPNDAMPQEVFDNLEALVNRLAEAALETEYGFRFPNLGQTMVNANIAHFQEELDFHLFPVGKDDV